MQRKAGKISSCISLQIYYKKNILLERIRFFIFIFMDTMLFNFQAFVDEMREKPDKKEIVEKYEKRYGPIQWGIQDQTRFKEYLTNFEYIPFATPEELGDDFDWALLQRLVAGSFSSDYELKLNADKDAYELYIAVKSWDQSVVKTISELRSFQMLRLYEIYIEEQMNIQILKKEEEAESEQWAIDAEREMRLKKRNAVRDTMGREKMAQEVKADQEQKLDDLLGKL